MPEPVTPPCPSSITRDVRVVHVWLAAVALVLAIGLAYANSLTGPMVYDDAPSITYNGSIRRLWTTDFLHAPGNGATVSGRPVLNLSFALNYAVGGLSVRGYHLTNVAIHTLAALTLFGLIRRTLELPTVAPALRSVALPTALGIAALWGLHPLNTEAVTYLAQRAESLMALFFLLTLYCAGRSFTPDAGHRWQILAWLACALGMGTKENMAAAPLIVLLYDRAFVAGSIGAAWRTRRTFYIGLATTWLVVAILVLQTGGNRGGSVGFGVGLNAMAYLATQIPALARYGALAFWPQPLVFDYGSFIIEDFGQIAGRALAVVLALIAAGYSLWRHPRLGLLAATIVTVLAPTSLIPGVSQMIVEHRMYLPLAAVLCCFIPLAALEQRRALGWAVVVAAVALALGTAARNRVYRSALALWTDTVEKRPLNAIAHSGRAAALSDLGRRAEALAGHRRALELSPWHVPSLANIGISLVEDGHPAEALKYLEAAAALDSRNSQVHLNLGVTLDLLHRSPEALVQFAEAVRLNPLLPAGLNAYGDALCRAGQVDAGIRELQKALELDPSLADAYFNLASAYVRDDRFAEGEAAFARGLALRTPDSKVYMNWGSLLLAHRHVAEALHAYETAVHLEPDSAVIHYNFGTALAAAERYEDAVKEFTTALQLRSDYAEAQNNLGNALLALNRTTEAIPAYEAALQLRPNDAATNNNLGLALARTGQLRAALPRFEAAARLAPDWAEAQANLTHARTQLSSEP